MTFHEAMLSQPYWVVMWTRILGAVIVGTLVILIFSKATRRDALIIFVTHLAVLFVMGWLFKQVGYVRLLGIVHVFLWTPLVVYLFRRLGDRAITFPFRQTIWLLLLVLSISLAFDYLDVTRYLLGERASLV